MSLHFVSGKPGGGKSYYSLRLIVDELVRGKRNIVTNLSVKIPDLAEYLAKKYDGNTFGISERLRVLTENETAQFWLYPCKHFSITKTIEIVVRKDRISRPDFGEREPYGGTLFVIDEIHLYFNARNWQSTGEDCLFYLSQHRKLGDDIVAVTQHINNVDKQFRSIAQDFSYVRNMAKERMGLFRLPSKMIRQTYSQPRTGSMGEKAQETVMMTLDITGLANCYDTAAGVGILSRSGSDTKERKRGLSFAWLLLGVLLAGGLIWFIPHAIGKGIKWASQTPPISTNSTYKVATSNSLPVHDNTRSYKLERPADEEYLASTKTAITNHIDLFVTGKFKLGGKWRVFLSDGRQLVQGEDTEMESLDNRGIILSGKRIEWAKPSPAAAGKNFAPPVSHNGTVILGPEPAARKVAISNFR